MPGGTKKGIRTELPFYSLHPGDERQADLRQSDILESCSPPPPVRRQLWDLTDDDDEETPISLSPGGAEKALQTLLWRQQEVTSKGPESRSRHKSSGASGTHLPRLDGTDRPP